MMKFLKIFSFLVLFCLPLFAQFGKNKVQYENFEIYTFSTTHFDIYFENGSDFLAEFTALESERFYQIFKQYLQYELDERIPILVYNSPNEFLQTNVIEESLPEGVQGFTEAFKSRVVLPFNGSYNDYRHVLHHELTHAIFHYYLFGGKIQNLINKRRFIQLPSWFEEGLPEFVSTFWDTEADMIIRDAQIHNYLPPIDYLDGYFAYKGGQSVYYYIYKKYGKEKIGELLRSVKSVNTANQLFKKVFGLEIEEFNEDWSKWVKTIYWRELSKREEADNFAKTFTDHTKDKSYFNIMPTLSPNGEYIAYISDMNDYPGLFIQSTAKKKDKWCLVKSGQKGSLESFHSFETRLSWANQSLWLAFVTQDKNYDVIVVYDAKKRKEIKRIELEMDGISSPSFSPDDQKIVFTGFKNGLQDIYLYNLATEELTPITEDAYTQKDPVISPDGQWVAFASDRPVNADHPDAVYQNRLGYHFQNIFCMDLETRQWIAVTKDSVLNETPAWSGDGKKLAYISDLNGIANIYIYDMAASKSEAITNILSGCKHISWAQKSDKIAFCSFIKGGWDIFILNNPLQRQGKYPQLSPTLFRETNEIYGFYQQFTEFTYGKSISMFSKTRANPRQLVFKFENQNYALGPVQPPDTANIAVTPQDSMPLAHPSKTQDDTLTHPRDSLGRPLIGDEYIEKVQTDIQKSLPYQTTFSPDIVTGNFYYDTYYGMGGQAVFAFSDVLGNHRIIIYSDLYYSFENSNIQAYYSYLAKKWDFGVNVFHFKYDYQLTYTDIYSSKQVGIQAYLAYPFNKYTRFESSLSSFALNVRKYLYDPYYNLIYPVDREDMHINIFQTRYIFDNILWGYTGPSNGWRYYLSYEQAIPLRPQDISFQRMTFDYRKYFNFRREYTLAVRFAGGKSFGANKPQFYLGGTENWLNYERREYSTWDMQETYMSELFLPMRGHPFYARKGEVGALCNLEFRFRFIDYLIFNWPAKFGFMAITGVTFLDMGAAWDQWRDFKLLQSGHLSSPIAAYGYGIRLNIGIALLKIDFAYPTSFAKPFKVRPRTMYSFGIDF